MGYFNGVETFMRNPGYWLAAVAIAALPLLARAETAPDAPTKSDPPPPIAVHVCPITLNPVDGNGAGHEVVGKYDVFFCCHGCITEFDQLTAEEKDKKVAVALQKQEDAEKKAAEKDKATQDTPG